MIVTSQGISSASSVGARIKYIGREGTLTYTQNMLSMANDLDGIKDEFLDNYSYLKNARGKNILFSELLSMPSQNNLSKERQVLMLKDIVAEHIKLRGFENHLAMVSIHSDTDKTHAHCLISSNELQGRTRHRVSKKTFLKQQK